MHVARKTNAGSAKLLWKILLYLQLNNEWPRCSANLNPEDFLLSIWQHIGICIFFPSYFPLKQAHVGFYIQTFVSFWGWNMVQYCDIWFLLTLTCSQRGLVYWCPYPLDKRKNWEMRFLRKLGLLKIIYRQGCKPRTWNQNKVWEACGCWKMWSRDRDWSHLWCLLTWKAIPGSPKASYFVAYLWLSVRVKTRNKWRQAMKCLAVGIRMGEWTPLHQEKVKASWCRI